MICLLLLFLENLENVPQIRLREPAFALLRKTNADEIVEFQRIAELLLYVVEMRKRLFKLVESYQLLHLKQVKQYMLVIDELKRPGGSSSTRRAGCCW